MKQIKCKVTYEMILDLNSSYNTDAEDELKKILCDEVNIALLKQKRKLRKEKIDIIFNNIGDKK